MNQHSRRSHEISAVVDGYLGIWGIYHGFGHKYGNSTYSLLASCIFLFRTSCFVSQWTVEVQDGNDGRQSTFLQGRQKRGREDAEEKRNELKGRKAWYFPVFNIREVETTHVDNHRRRDISTILPLMVNDGQGPW